MKERESAYKYRTAAVGGTFDHIHKGHKELIGRAFETAEKVYIGLTSDRFAAAVGKKIDNNFEVRKEELERFVKETYPGRTYEITKLEKNFGPGMYTHEIEAVVVSDETKPRVAEANEKRLKLGLPPLKIEVVPLILAEDGQRISSTRIRSGEIDSSGQKLRQKTVGGVGGNLRNTNFLTEFFR